ncbi:50S ribosomal protein L9 [Hyphococcus flavus]|uniref:Large ribosomal subunit protein bL9 n=1 Tax=Hyphococcus flavus TaxID=1866326 RepID=A0AAF0CEU7_9PROT|nr:50S ribosomal protein L9 [Hyphococcus flavus]WDI30734.1 50S ribosomal protein L9 [Hyphococcus flavus]
MEVILLERVENLGQMGDVVKVRPGYARNFLLPQKKALRANDNNKKVFEAQKAELEARNLERKKEAEAAASKIDGQSFVLIRQSSETGVLYGSVSSRDIAHTASEAGVHITPSQVRLDKPLKALGVFGVRVKLHPEVDVTINVNIARSEDEAERQARGENVLARAEDKPVEEEASEDAAPEFFDEGAGVAVEENTESDNEENKTDVS